MYLELGPEEVLGESKDGDMRVTLVGRRGWWLGENVLLNYVVENVGRGKVKVSFGGDYRGGMRAARIKVTATDARGQPVEDPFPSNMNFGGLGGDRELAAGEEFAFAVPLPRYCRFESEGTYTLRVAHDLGGDDPIPKDDPRWVSAEIELKMPDPRRAEAIVDAMRRLPVDQGLSVGDRTGPYPDFSALRYPIYLPVLRKLVAAEPRAFQGIAAIPSVDATRALIELAEHDDPKVAAQAVETLVGRVPVKVRSMFPKEREHLLEHGWDAQALGLAVHALAERLLSDTDPEVATLGAELLGAVVKKGDLSIVTAGLDRGLPATVAAPISYPEPRTPVGVLRRTAKAMLAAGAKPSGDPKTPGEIAIYLFAHGTSPSRPSDYEKRAAGWLDHPIPQIRVYALRETKAPVGGPMRPKLAPLLASDHQGVQNAACEALGAIGDDASVRSAVVAAMKTATDEWLVRCLHRTAIAVGVPRDRIAALWTSRLHEVDHTMLMLNQLMFVLESNGGGSSGLPDATEAKRLQKRWERFTKKHAKRIRKGKKFTLDDPALTPDLVPPGMTRNDRKGQRWPK